MSQPKQSPEPFDFSKITVPEHRTESDILADLERLCASPGYAHTLAFICWQENFIGYSEELTPNDLDEMKSLDRLSQVHDFTMGFGKSGITVHSCRGWNDQAANRLYAHCAGRKYSQKADRWFGLALNPDSDEFIWMAMGLNAPWQHSEEMEAFLKTMPNVRHKNLKQALRGNQSRSKPKIGRNDPCICGSGKKDKKCCKNSS